MSDLPLLLLSADKENRIEFNVFVEGTTSSAFANPFVRLVFEEENGRAAWCFPTKKIGNGTYEAVVQVEPKYRHKNLFRAYIEVILQDYYFVPVESLAKFDSEITEPKVTMSELKGFKRRYTTEMPVIRVNEQKRASQISVTVGDVRVVSKG